MNILDSWKRHTDDAKDIALTIGGNKVALEYLEGSLLGDFYRKDRPGDVPIYHLAIYQAQDDKWQPVYTRGTKLDLSLPRETLFYWIEKIHRALQDNIPEQAALACPHLLPEEESAMELVDA